MSFDESLENHLNAVRNRDLEAFRDTLSGDDKITIILPNGSTLRGINEIVDFHRNWFADKDWTLDLEPVQSWHSENTGCAIFEVSYNDLDATGNPYQLFYLLSLVFINQDGQWLLIHDQNTMLTSSRS